MRQYTDYCSGFIGSREVELDYLQTDEVNRYMAMGLFRENITKYSKVYYCKKTDYFNRHTQSVMGDMSLTTELLALAYKHFGLSVGEFLHRHDEYRQKALFSSNRYHGEFIADTVICAMTGRHRSIPISGWTKLIQAGKGQADVRLSKIFNHTAPQYQTLTTQQLLTQWISTPGGVMDLIQTLNMMYGVPAHSAAQ